MWVPVLRKAAAGPPVAVVVVEAGGAWYGALAAAALAGGFAPAVGGPPRTDAVLDIRGGVPVRLRLAGGRAIWVPAAEVLV
ncbi:hypothetical protein VR45_34580, partial [Streptomyces sp. NRRL S-495]